MISARLILLCSAALSVVALGLPSSPAEATTTNVRTYHVLRVQHQSLDAASQLSILFDSAAVLTPGVLQQLAGRSALTRQIPETTQPPGGSNWYSLSCAAGPHAASDTDGTMTPLNNCPYALANWSYRLSTYLQSVTISLVAESGMSWQRNAAAMSRNASHLVPVSYLFHGTFNPVRESDYVSCGDAFTFRVDIGGNTGTATVTATCAFQAVP